MYKKASAYFKKHVLYTSLIHLIGGIGIGIIIARPIAAEHPLRWGLALIIISLFGHLYAWSNKS